MDDKDVLRYATDCVLDDSEMSNSDHTPLPDFPLQVEFESSLPVADNHTGAIAGQAPSAPTGGPGAVADGTAVCNSMDAEGLLAQQTIEALLFSSDSSLSAARLADLVGTITPSVVRRHIEALNAKYEQAGLSFRIEAIARGYRMMTLPDFRDWVAKLNKQRSEARLSPAALEALSIIAYRQPVIRADIEAIRGVACGEVISRLREIGLVRIVGRAEVVGRPLLYGTTKKFLDAFGLADLDDLPPMEALKLRSASKPVEEVEPVPPPPVLEPTPEQVAVAGA